MAPYQFISVMFLFLCLKGSSGGLIFGGRQEPRHGIHLPSIHIDAGSSHEHHEKPFDQEDLNPDNFCQGPCKDGWIYYLGQCHIYVSQKLNWKDAERHCQSLFGRAHLTSIMNNGHNNFLMAVARSQSSRGDKFWSGGNNERGSNSWADGSPVNFLNFLKSNVRGFLFGGRLCLGINIGGGDFWNGISCAQKLPFICMYTPSSPNTGRIQDNGRTFKDQSNATG
ncbi:snaclec botrocetin subunit alpha-like [Discoglossus pictus]